MAQALLQLASPSVFHPTQELRRLWHTGCPQPGGLLAEGTLAAGLRHKGAQFTQLDLPDASPLAAVGSEWLWAHGSGDDAFARWLMQAALSGRLEWVASPTSAPNPVRHRSQEIKHARTTTAV